MVRHIASLPKRTCSRDDKKNQFKTCRDKMSLEYETQGELVEELHETLQDSDKDTKVQ